MVMGEYFLPLGKVSSLIIMFFLCWGPRGSKAQHMQAYAQQAGRMLGGL
jgi:hypothetical protein